MTTKKAFIIAVTMAVLGVLGGPPVVSAQSIGQPQTTVPSPPQQLPDQSRFPMPSAEPRNPLNNGAYRKKAMMDDNFKKLRQHAQDLTALAKSLQEQIEKTNENVLSLEIVKKAEQVEKLAKKIKKEAKGGL